MVLKSASGYTLLCILCLRLEAYMSGEVCSLKPEVIQTSDRAGLAPAH